MSDSVAVTIFSRHGCHLCESAIAVAESLKESLNYSLEIIYIDGDEELELQHGEKVPVTLINGELHEIWRLESEKFKASLERHRLHR